MKNYFSLLWLFFTVVSTVAQTTPPNPNPPPPGLPVDGILGILGLTALIYGAIKKYKNLK